MKKPQELAAEELAMNSMVELTSIFEGIASMKIAQTKNQVLKSQEFFNELWNIYTQIRVDEMFHFGRTEDSAKVSNKTLCIIITGEGGFSGDIDQKLIQLMLKTHDSSKQDIIVIGHHGAIQLAQRGVSFKKYFKLPQQDENINTWPIIKEVLQYQSTTAYYQTYVSLMVQDVKQISLSSAVAERAKNVQAGHEEISEKTYIFEPSTYDLISHLERSMLQIALSQIILESKLAQYASRFRAMSAAHNKADETYHEIHTQYNRAKRAIKDERLKEIINGLRKAKAAA
jgi:F-type H+-transporting ATPase subunit gamma